MFQEHKCALVTVLIISSTSAVIAVRLPSFSALGPLIFATRVTRIFATSLKCLDMLYPNAPLVRTH